MDNAVHSARYRIELIVALISVAILVAFGVTQHYVLDQPAARVGETNVRYVGLIGVPLDDVYIHCRYAQNLLAGNGYGFNRGTNVTADTSPLWIGLIAIGGLITSDLPQVSIALSALFYVILSIGVTRAARDLFGLSPSLALVAGVLTALSSRLVWAGMSGMETSLAALLMFLVVEEHERSRQRNRLRVREGIWLGLGILTRPEFFFVAIVLLIDWIYLARTSKADTSRAFSSIVTAVVIGSPSVLLPLIFEGSLVSHSSIVQGAGMHLLPNLGYLWFAAKILASNNVVLVLLIAAFIMPIARDRRYRVALIIAIGLPVLQAFVAPQFRHHGRYFFPIIPLVILLGVAALTKLRAHFTLPAAQRILAICAVIAGLLETGRWALLEAESVRNINDQHLAAAAFLRARMTGNDHLAADDVGAVGYYTGRRIIDLTGLISPEMYPLQRDQNAVWQQARNEGANLFLIYNRLNPSFYEAHRDSLSLIREFRVRKPLVSAADTVMSLYTLRHAD